MKKLFLVLFLISASLVSAAEPLNCAEQPGRSFCGKMNRFLGTLGPCTGSACNIVWSDQVRVIRVLLNEYYDLFLPGDVAGTDIGLLANKTAHELCSYTLTGDPQSVDLLSIEYNRYLSVLKQLQEMAGLPIPYSCTFAK